VTDRKALPRSWFGVLAEREFRLFFTGYTTSLVGAAMVPVALVFAVLEQGRSTADVGYVLAAETVPLVTLLLAGGVIADRLSRRTVMLGADLVRCVSELLLAALVLTGSPPLWVFMVLAGVIGAGQAFFGSLAEKGEDRRSEFRGPRRVHVVADRNSQQLAHRHPGRELRQLVLGNMTTWAAANEQRRCRDPGESIPPGRVGLVDLADNRRHNVPVEGQESRRALRDGTLPRERRRRVLKDQSLDPAGLLLGNQVGHHPTHRMPDQRDRVQGKLVEDANDVITHQLERIRARAVAFPVPTQVDGHYPEERRELGRHDVPGPARLAEGVQQHHRRCVGRPLDVARQPDIVDLDIKVLAHPGDPSEVTGEKVADS